MVSIDRSLTSLWAVNVSKIVDCQWLGLVRLGLSGFRVRVSMVRQLISEMVNQEGQRFLAPTWNSSERSAVHHSTDDYKFFG